MIKFIKGWDPAFFGAETLDDGSEPYYSNNEFGTLILDRSGITLWDYNIETDDELEFKQEFKLTSGSVKFIIDGIELLNDSQIEFWVENFKSNAKLIQY
jgi:hypothetical protein